MTTPSGTSAPRRALVVVAHLDDADFGSAGTAARWTRAGAEVAYCICTSDRAGAPTDRSPEHVADLHLRREIIEVIRSVRPDVVLTRSPEINWARIAISHPDHRAVGEAAPAAVQPDARNRSAHPELTELEPWAVPALRLSESPDERINSAIDITDLFETKLAALAAHRSQIDGVDELRDMLRGHLERNARDHDVPGRLAEVFQVVDTS